MELFLLPHQDDEFGIFHVIEQALAQRRNFLIVYLTDGAYGKASTQIRSAKSPESFRPARSKERSYSFIRSVYRRPQSRSSTSVGLSLQLTKSRAADIRR